jgi:D-glycero-alpha-D-manno-heptose-7-phosphate kinase
MGDIPSAGSGLGSSSAVTVAALHAMYTYRGDMVPAEQLAREACEIEINTLKKPIGMQDQYISAYGDMRFISFHKDGSVSAERLNLTTDSRRELDDHLMLFFTGVTRQAETILAEQQGNIQSRIQILREIRDIARVARDEICRGNLDSIGVFLHQSWELKKRLASKISNTSIDEMYAAALNAGALGGKITGAGGGGFLMLYCPPSCQPDVRKALGNLQEMPFQLERDGTKVIFNYRR